MDRIKSADFGNCELIINPSRFPQYAKILRKIVKRSNFAKIVESRSREHFIESVREFSRSPHTYLLVWGGDGTAHDTINTLLADAPEKKLAKKAVGFLRGGSGNGIQDSYEVPFSLKKQLWAYAESTQNGWVEAVDLLGIEHENYTEFGQLIGVGFDVRVLNYRNTLKKMTGRHSGHPRPGIMNYIKAAMHAFFAPLFTDEEFKIDLYRGKYAYRGYRVNAEFPFDHLRRSTPIPMAEIGTRPYYGRLFKVCPDVVCNDGKLDLYLFNFLDRFSIIKNLLLLWRGDHGKINKKLIRHGKPVIERYEVSECVLSKKQAFPYHIDGELRQIAAPEDGSDPELRVKVYPKAIRFIVPGTFYRKFHPDFTN